MITWNNLDTLEAFKNLSKAERVNIAEAMSGENGAERVKTYSTPMAEGLAYNYAAKQVDDKVLEDLQKLADEAQLTEKFEALYNGEVINTGEKRMVLHHLTRGQLGEAVNADGTDKRAFYKEQQQKIADFANKVHAGEITNAAGEKFTTVVQIGIGGSDLGPRAMYLALENWAKKNDTFKMEAKFISNVDPDDAAAVLYGIDVAHSIFILVSKSGTTLETLTNESFVKDALKNAGLTGVSCDTEVWKQVWTEEEIANNGSTPIFLLSGKKRESFCLNHISVEPGNVWTGYLELGQGEFRLPAAVLHGTRPGKTMLITAGVHGGEYVGIQAAIELSQKLKIQKVAGTIIIVKVINVPAFERRNGSMGLTDGKNLNREFPGNPKGTEMERLAWAVSHELQPAADYYIDLHSGDDYEQLTSYVYYAGMADEKTVSQSRRMAEQVDVPYMVRSNVASGGAYNYAASQGIPSILIERGGMGAWTSEEVRSTRRDVRNILCHLGIYQGKKDYRTYYPLDVTDICYQDASRDGLWYPFKKPGDMIREGEILGEVRDYEGGLLELSVAEYDGVILYQTGTLQVLGDGPMIAYGKIVNPYDERKERIVSYWEKRSGDFLEHKRAELHSPMSERWLYEIKNQLPQDRNLRVLDVGCGAGFFSVLLAKEGYQVTGVDLTPDMVENARTLAEEEKTDCEFFVMDAENLRFADESFDVVISRNLTWTLPDVKSAYREWVRVLKKGGILLNFDANYGLSDFTDLCELPDNHAHQEIGDDMMRECEEIKRQLPISSYSRPAWDLETLGAMKLQEFSVDLGISSRIYVEKDEFYNPTPMFMLRTCK